MFCKMKKIIIPILLGFTLFAVSCEKMLEIPQKGVVSATDFYKSDDDALAALTDMYATYIQNVAGTQGIDNPEQVMLNYSADDVMSAGTDASDHEDFRVFGEFRYDNANGTLKEAYQRYYYAVYHANLVISHFTNENRLGEEPAYTSAVTNQCVAEARVMRAYLHMMLALSWNCPPIMDRVYEGDELPTNAESQSQVLEWVISECEKAISSGSLPKRNGPTDKNATARMSVGFAQFVAGKAAVFNNDMATARKYLGDLINSGNYKLIPSDEYWTNFHVSGDGNSEKIFEPNILEDATLIGSKRWDFMFRGRWMVANVFCWRTDRLASQPMVHDGFQGWNGGGIQEDFAKKFLAHDGDSPRRKACFLTGDEWLYEMDWASDKNDAPLAEKKTDPKRGIVHTDGIFSHGPYFEWKHMVYINPPKILTGGKTYPTDNMNSMGKGHNQKNFNVARYAEALLLYAEACIGSGDEAKGLAALQEVQQRSGSGKISSKLTFEDMMEEKQYEMWFESCRFHDLVRWSNLGKVDIKAIFNSNYGGINKHVPSVKDAFFTDSEPEHRLYVTYSQAKHNDFEDKYKYFPFPRDFKQANPNLHDVLGWKSAEDSAE